MSVEVVKGAKSRTHVGFAMLMLHKIAKRPFSLKIAPAAIFQQHEQSHSPRHVRLDPSEEMKLACTLQFTCDVSQAIHKMSVAYNDLAARLRSIVSEMNDIDIAELEEQTDVSIYSRVIALGTEKLNKHSSSLNRSKLFSRSMTAAVFKLSVNDYRSIPSLILPN